jgi:hypothetical protein
MLIPGESCYLGGVLVKMVAEAIEFASVQVGRFAQK